MKMAREQLLVDVQKDGDELQYKLEHASLWTRVVWVTEVMLVVSKQRVMRHKLSTDVNWIFSDVS